jgi:ABC-type transport system involved in multi-copper enzyme maturation permease subunit
MIAAQENFVVNLFKSLLIMWLMAILVITVAIFCSTFLSWPIAIVLTLVILLGHWGIEQLGDATLPGIGPQIVNDMGFSDPNQAKVVSTSVEALSHGLRILSTVLPDISQFAATDDIEQGLAVPASRLTDSLIVLATYGMATMALSYFFLRQKEVAP